MMKNLLTDLGVDETELLTSLIDSEATGQPSEIEQVYTIAGKAVDDLDIAEDKLPEVQQLAVATAAGLNMPGLSDLQKAQLVRRVIANFVMTNEGYLA